MDNLKMIEHLSQKACVVAVRINSAENKREITIEDANKAYLESVNKQNEEFVPGRPYTYYISEEPNFESMVIRCVSAKKTQHQYVNANLYNAWLDLYAIPLDSDGGETDYCLFTYEMTPEPESDKLIDITPYTAAQVLKTCVRLRQTDNFQAAMDSIIRDIRHMCDSRACSILLTDFDAKKCSILCVDHDDSFSSARDDIVFLDAFYEIAATWRELMGGSNCYIVMDEYDMKILEEKDPIWAESMRNSHVHNVVLYPLRSNNKIIGYLFATNFNTAKINVIKEVMELNAFILAAEIASHQMYEKMERMSRYDMLTGVLNRNAMNNRIAECKSGVCPIENDFGVVFVDVNGLKHINDIKGHQAGDEMIRTVAERLQDIFKGYEIYRAGGDEFMVIAEGCTRSEFNDLIEKLRDQNDEDDVHFAVGSFFDELDHDIHTALHSADADMYYDKSAYYRNHPELSRRTE